MNEKDIYNQLVEEFSLKGLGKDDQEEMLYEVAKTIHKQFLTDIYFLVNEKDRDAIRASASMGEAFYTTTIKHLVPNYEQVFIEAKNKVVKAFSQQA